MIDISIIIPTRNRQDILRKTLSSLFCQSYPPQCYEIIVVDDGSSDGTEAAVRSLVERAPCELKYFRQDPRGPAAARNLGIREARGEILLFLGDDIVGEQELLAEHVGSHRREPRPNLAVLGFTTWHPEVRRTPFVEYLDSTDIQFGYGGIENPEDLSYEYFYTSNISIPREFLLKNGTFDENFKCAVYEDSELGYRLKEKGLRMALNRKAIAFHLHQVTFSGFRRRQRLAGYSAVLFHRKHPELKDILIQDLQEVFGVGRAIGWVTVKCRIKEILILLQEWLHLPETLLPLNLSSAYGMLLNYSYYLGVQEGLRSSS